MLLPLRLHMLLLLLLLLQASLADHCHHSLKAVHRETYVVHVMLHGMA